MSTSRMFQNSFTKQTDDQRFERKSEKLTVLKKVYPRGYQRICYRHRQDKTGDDEASIWRRKSKASTRERKVLKG